MLFIIESCLRMSTSHFYLTKLYKWEWEVNLFEGLCAPEDFTSEMWETPLAYLFSWEDKYLHENTYEPHVIFIVNYAMLQDS